MAFPRLPFAMDAPTSETDVTMDVDVPLPNEPVQVPSSSELPSTLTDELQMEMNAPADMIVEGIPQTTEQRAEVPHEEHASPEIPDASLEDIEATTFSQSKTSSSQDHTLAPVPGPGSEKPLRAAVPAKQSSPASRDPHPKTESRVLPIHRVLGPTDTDDLVGTIQDVFESSEEVAHNGVVLLDAPHLIPPAGSLKMPPQSHPFEATSQRVMIPAKIRGHGIVVIKHDTAEMTNRHPSFPDARVLTIEEMERAFEENTDKEAGKFTRHPYFNIDISEYKIRPKGSFELTCGSPMDKLSYIAGMNTPYGYFSKKVSHFGAHVEDWHCASYNIHFAGATKLWIAVKPSSKDLFEAKVRELFPDSGECVQFIRHQALNIAPSTLRKWGVEHFFVPQNPGHVVAVTGHTYHWGLNTGTNYAEAINLCLEKDWKAAEDFRNCYPGCGINHASLPLPKPVFEEGTMEEKKEKALIRDEALRKQWEIRVAEWEAAEEAKQAAKRPKKRQTETPRRRSEARASGRRLNGHASSDDENDSQLQVEDDTLRERIEISAIAKEVNGRQYRRRSAKGRDYTEKPESSPGSSEEDDDEDDEPPVIRTRPKPSGHSRHNSGHHMMSKPQSQPDMSALLSEMKLMKGFMMEQKQAAAKNEDILKAQLAYQKKMSDKMSHQLDVTQKMLSVLLGMDHRMMLATQAMETRSMQSASQVSSNAPSEMYGPSATSAHTMHNTTQQLHQRFAAMDGRSPHAMQQSRPDAHHRNHPQHAQQHPLRRQAVAPETSIHAMVSAFQRPQVPSESSSQMSRRPSLAQPSEQAPSEAGDHASSSHSPNIPATKSMQSTPQIDAETASSAPSSIPDLPNDESVIMVQTKTKTNLTAQTAAPLEDEAELTQADESELSEPDSEYLERPKSKPTPKTRPAADTPTNATPSSPAGVPRPKCKPCTKRSKECNRATPSCSDCVDNEITCEYSKPEYWSRSGPKGPRKTKRVAEDSPAPASASTKRSKRAVSVAKADSTRDTTPTSTPDQNSTQLDIQPQGNLKSSRELMGLFATSESNVFAVPNESRRAKSRPLQT